jgi:hypothetical protein
VAAAARAAFGGTRAGRHLVPLIGRDTAVISLQNDGTSH